jgi:hypothetical protein
MATIKHKRGTSDPGTSDVAVGELAINTADGGLFTQTDGGSVVEIGSGGGGTVADGCVYENSQTISNNYTMSTNKNGMTAGPVTVSATVTIPSGSSWSIV